jgi:glucosyl-dolichyl phosphate glucuronosyltransferase
MLKRALREQSSIAVVIATFNGGEILRRTLEGYRQQKPIDRPWRIVIADNNSSDETPSIIEEFSSSLPLESVHVDRQGKNVALNVALTRLRPDDSFVILSDDDALPVPNFLEAWDEADQSFDDVELFGGKVTLSFPGVQPDWMKQFEKNFDVIYAINDRPDGEIEAHQIFGPNMAVRRSVFAQGLRFNEEIGPNSGDPGYPMGSETEFCVRAARELKLKARFVGTTAVAHQIRPHQTEMAFIQGRAYRHGRGVAMQQIMTSPKTVPAPWKTAVRVNLYRLLAMAGAEDALWQQHWWRGFHAAQIDSQGTG